MLQNTALDLANTFKNFYYMYIVVNFFLHPMRGLHRTKLTKNSGENYRRLRIFKLFSEKVNVTLSENAEGTVFILQNFKTKIFISWVCPSESKAFDTAYMLRQIHTAESSIQKVKGELMIVRIVVYILLSSIINCFATIIIHLFLYLLILCICRGCVGTGRW
jgi:hypothetical protein